MHVNRTIQLDIPESLYEAVVQAARDKGTSAEDWILTNVTARLPSTRELSPKPAVETDGAARRFRSSFGTIDSGNPHSADNDAIDADLALAYDDTSDEEH